MIYALAAIGYILVGTYSTFINEPWWYKQNPMRYKKRDWSCCDKCLAHLTESEKWGDEIHVESTVWAIIVSGVFWPLFPFVKYCFKKRREVIAAQKKQAEREKEMKDAEEELKDITT